MSYRDKKCLVLVALEMELPATAIEGIDVYYTGVGKINAALKAAEVIHHHQPDLIINYGTAGGLDTSLSGLLEVGVLHQRDMDAVELGFALGETPFDDVHSIYTGFGEVSCGTGDNFVTAPPKLTSHMVDMEAYAIAKACQRHDVAFRCLKYISDNANSASKDDWQTNVAKGQKLFVDWLKATILA